MCTHLLKCLTASAQNPDSRIASDLHLTHTHCNSATTRRWLARKARQNGQGRNRRRLRLRRHLRLRRLGWHLRSLLHPTLVEGGATPRRGARPVGSTALAAQHTGQTSRQGEWTAACIAAGPPCLAWQHHIGATSRLPLILGWNVHSATSSSTCFACSKCQHGPSLWLLPAALSQR